MDYKLPKGSTAPNPDCSDTLDFEMEVDSETPVKFVESCSVKKSEETDEYTLFKLSAYFEPEGVMTINKDEYDNDGSTDAILKVKF